MAHLLSEEERKVFISLVKANYETFKVNNGRALSEQMQENYREGIIDLCDSLIGASSQLTFDVASLRNEIEEMFDEMDGEEE